tara:strand:+ start:1189 stop:1608 length:420 start_codon:yes stop_codon:yes gene_type:complete
MKRKTFDEDADWRLKEVHHDINKVGKSINHAIRQIEIVEGYCVKMSAAIELLSRRIKMIEEKQGGVAMPQDNPNVNSPVMKKLRDDISRMYAKKEAEWKDRDIRSQGFNQEEYDKGNVPDWYGAGDDNLWKKKDEDDGR